jgi:hypothetical protein
MLDHVTGSVPVTNVDPELDVADKSWYDAEPYPRIEEELFPYDLGDKEMKELCKSMLSEPVEHTTDQAFRCRAGGVRQCACWGADRVPEIAGREVHCYIEGS